MACPPSQVQGLSHHMQVRRPNASLIECDARGSIELQTAQDRDVIGVACQLSGTKQGYGNGCHGR